MEHDQELKHRIDEAFFQIAKEVVPNQRDDLRRMWRHARDLWTKMDIELVNCRKLNRATPRYTELENQCRESIETVERYITWGHLSG